MFSVNLDGKQKKVKVRLRVDADIHAKKINAAYVRGEVLTLWPSSVCNDSLFCTEEERK